MYTDAIRAFTDYLEVEDNLTKLRATFEFFLPKFPSPYKEYIQQDCIAAIQSARERTLSINKYLFITMLDTWRSKFANAHVESERALRDMRTKSPEVQLQILREAAIRNIEIRECVRRLLPDVVVSKKSSGNIVGR